MLIARNINKTEYSQPTKIEPYSKLNHKFIQKSKLSNSSIRVVLYLRSFPKTWIPRPLDIQKNCNFGDFVWRRVSKELREAGYLRLKLGPKGKGGSVLEFDEKGRFRDVGFEQVQKGAETWETNGHINNNSISKQYINKTTTTPTNTTESPDMKTLDANVVVTLEKRMKDEVGLTERDIQQLLSIYPVDQIIEKLGMLKEATVDNPIGWFKAALKRNFPSRKPKPLTTGSLVDHAKQMAHIEASDRKHWEDRHNEYKATQTEDQLRLQENLMKRFGSRKRDSRSASI